MKKLTLMMLLVCSLLVGCNSDTTTVAPAPKKEQTPRTESKPKPKTESKVMANIINSQNKKIGTAVFSEEKNGVQVKLDVKDLPPGKHGLHIHQTGKCIAPDFKSADGHFNPEMKKHGKENPDGSHAGDLENIVVPSNGELQITQTIQGVTLKKGEKNSLHKSGNTAIVVHEKEDDYQTDPAGAAGKRIACGVIK